MCILKRDTYINNTPGRLGTRWIDINYIVSSWPPVCAAVLHGSVINMCCLLYIAGMDCNYAQCNLNYTKCKNNTAKEEGYECVCQWCSCATEVRGNETCTLGEYVIVVCHALSYNKSRQPVFTVSYHILDINVTRIHSRYSLSTHFIHWKHWSCV